MQNSADILREEVIHITTLKSSSALRGVPLTLPALQDDVIELVFEGLSDDKLTSSRPITKSDDAPLQPLAIGPILSVPILDAVQLTKGDGIKKVIDISLDLRETDISFQPGDTVGVIPSNPTNEVSQLLKHLTLFEKSTFMYTLKLKDSTSKRITAVPVHIPRSSSIQHVLQNCLEIRSVPKKLFLRVLAEYTADPLEKRRLEELCSRQGAKEYNQFVVEAKTTFLDILEVFPSCCPPIERIFEFLPRLQARPYSIASSPLDGPTAHIVFSLLELPCKDPSKARHGICTGWLYSISNSKPQKSCISEQLQSLNLVHEEERRKPTIPLYFRKSNGFRLPEDPAVNLILIGPGTGVAPFIGFLQHRQLQKKDAPDLSVGETWLFFGCKHPKKDFLYKHKIDEFLKCGILSKLFVSFSQYTDDPAGTSGTEKYVQDNIRLHSKEFVSQLMDKNSMVYVCGDAANMAKDVSKQIVAVIKHEKDISEETAQQWLNEYKSQGKYLQDIWT